MKLLGVANAFEEKQHRFTASICEHSKQCVDFAAPISEESVHGTLGQVLNAFRTATK
jgi:hypothetical protein